MHHSLRLFDIYPLRLYGRYRELVLRFYIFMAGWTKIPLIGKLVIWAANLYGNREHKGYLLTLDEAEAIVDIAEGLALGPCTCRQVFKNCDNPIDVEIVFGLTRSVYVGKRLHDYREISKQEAKDILRQCHQRGLIPSIAKCQRDFYAICNCCPCCCVPFRLSKKYGINSAFTRNGDIVQEFRKRQLLSK